MFRKYKNFMNSAYLTTLILINSSNFTEQANFKPSFFDKAKNKLENIIGRSEPTTNIFDTRADFIETAHDKYNTLLDNALKRDDYRSIDSVIKIVPKDILEEYISTNPNNNSTNYNRLNILTKTGNEVAHKRFKSDKTSSRSLIKMANSLDVKLGDYGRGSEIKNFLELYREDIIETANKYDLNPSLLAAVAIHESGGRTFTASRTGALGAFGLTKYAYKPQGVWFDGTMKEDINPFHTLDAMDRAADMLSGLIKRYERFDDANHSLALTAYNQGEGEVNKALRGARRDGVKNPKKIINHKQNTYVNKVDSITQKMDEELNTEKFLIASSQGRNYSAKVQQEIMNVKPYFTQSNTPNS